MGVRPGCDLEKEETGVGGGGQRTSVTVPAFLHRHRSSPTPTFPDSPVPGKRQRTGALRNQGGIYAGVGGGREAGMLCALNTQARGCLACTRAHPSLPTSARHQVLLHSPQSVSQHRHCQLHGPVAHARIHTQTHAHPRLGPPSTAQLQRFLLSHGLQIPC